EGFIVENRVTDIFNAGLREVIESLVGLRQAGAAPAARSLAPEFLDDVHRFHDHAALIVELVHRHLVVTVRVELPAVFDARLDDLGVSFANSRIQRDRGLCPNLPEHLSQSPEADPHPVLMPAPVRHVWELRLALRRRNDHARHWARNIPLFERQHRPHHQPNATGESKRRAFGDRRERKPVAWLHHLSGAPAPYIAASNACDESVNCEPRAPAAASRPAARIRSAWCRTRRIRPQAPSRARRRAHARRARRWGCRAFAGPLLVAASPPSRRPPAFRDPSG